MTTPPTAPGVMSPLTRRGTLAGAVGGKTMPLIDLEVRGRRLVAELFYPRQPGQINEVEVGLSDVRASDSLLISYDFERNGWSIKQASRFEWPADGSPCDPDWQEVAFIGSWSRQVAPCRECDGTGVVSLGDGYPPWTCPECEGKSNVESI